MRYLGMGNYVAAAEPLGALSLPEGAGKALAATGILVGGIALLMVFGIVKSPFGGGGSSGAAPDAHVLSHRRELMRRAKAKGRMRAARAAAKKTVRARKRAGRKGRRR